MDLMDGFVNNDKFIWCIDNFRKSYCIKMNIVKVKNLQQKIWKFDWKKTTWNINYRNKLICLIICTLKVLNYKKKYFLWVLQSSNHKINNLI